MSDDAHAADYYRRRADSQATLAAAARDPKIRELHEEIVELYKRRAEIHAARANSAALPG